MKGDIGKGAGSGGGDGKLGIDKDPNVVAVVVVVDVMRLPDCDLDRLLGVLASEACRVGAMLERRRVYIVEVDGERWLGAGVEDADLLGSPMIKIPAARGSKIPASPPESERSERLL